MKRTITAILSIIIIAFMLFGTLFGCAGNPDGDPPTTPPTTGDGTQNGGDESTVQPTIVPVLNPVSDDIFGDAEKSRPFYSDKDEFNGQIQYSDNGVMAYSTLGVKSIKYNWEETDQYNLYTALLPFWRTQNIYNETVTFKSIDDEATLLYTPTRIISVYDYFLEKEYIQNVDYIIDGNKIKLTKATSINYWTNYYLDEPAYIAMVTATGKFIYASETEPNKHQISISYEHEGSWKGYVPIAQSNKIPLSISKLKKGEKINIGVIGDSITYGRGSSGDFGYGAKNPRYATLVYRYLKQRYPTSDIVCENVAVGGKDSAWGSTAQGIGNFSIVPDISIVALGMNDLYTSLQDYYLNIEKIITGLRYINPNMEIILVSPMSGNAEIMRYDSNNNQPTNISYYGEMAKFEDELVKLSNLYSGVIVAPVSGITKSIYDTGKRFEDVNSNNLNHPNDFIHRVYAQTILKSMLGDDFIAL